MDDQVYKYDLPVVYKDDMKVESISPTQGSSKGGTEVKIIGEGLEDATVKIDGVVCEIVA